MTIAKAAPIVIAIGFVIGQALVWVVDAAYNVLRVFGGM